MIHRSIARFTVAVALIVPLLHDTPAKAGLCVNLASITAPDNYKYHRCGVPDIDQKRDPVAGLILGLPGGGRSHCVPTATLNWLGYIANHGYPNVALGPMNYQASHPADTDGYNLVTLMLLGLGAAMDTDPDTGTNAEDAVVPIQNHLDMKYPGLFATMYVGAQDDFAPHMDTAITPFALIGGLVMLRVGWYDKVIDLPPNLPDLYVRDGGHLVSLMDVTRTPASRTISIHDPGSQDDATLQGPVSTDTYGVSSVQGVYDGELRWQDQVIKMGGKSVGAIDGFLAILPKFGVITKNTEISIVKPIRFTITEEESGEDQEEFTTYDVGRQIEDLALSEISGLEPYLVEGDDTIHTIDISSGVRGDLARVPGAKRLTYGGRNQTLYVLADAPTRGLPLSPKPVPKPSSSIVAIDHEGRVLTTAATEVQLDAVAYDPTTDELVAASLSTGVLQRYTTDLELVSSHPLPVPSCDPTAKVSLEVATDGAVWVHCDASGIAYRVGLGRDGRYEATPIELRGSPTGGPAPATGFTVDERGHLFATINGSLMEFRPDGSPIVEGSRFTGQPGGETLRIIRPFTNVLPGISERIEDRDS